MNRLPEPLALLLTQIPERDQDWVDGLNRVDDPAGAWDEAARFERMAFQLDAVGARLRRLADSGDLGAWGSARCAELVSALGESAGRAGAFAGELRARARAAEDLVTELVRALRREGDGLGESLASTVRRVLERAEQQHPPEPYWYPTAARQHPALPEHPNPTPAATVWSSWPPAAPAPMTPRPGTGPTLGSTDADRADPETGVRIAQLPDTTPRPTPASQNPRARESGPPPP